MTPRVFTRRDERGQSLVEFAIVVPLFLMMLFGIIDLGRVIWANDALANAAREGARYASVHGNAVIANHTTATRQEIKDYTLDNFTWAGGSGLTVTVCYSPVLVASGSATTCSGDVDSGAINARGALVTVVVRSTVPILTGSLLGMGDFSVSGSSTVLVNN